MKFSRTSGGSGSSDGHGPVSMSTTGVPDGPARLPTLIVLALLGIAVAVWRFLPGETDVRRELGRWLVACAAGTLALLAAYAPFVPGGLYYSPLAPYPLANRVNIFATPAFVLFFYSLAMVAAMPIAAF